VTFGQLLRVFFTTHDPTTLDRQGPDWGRQYRSAVFFAGDEEKRVAEAYISQLGQAGVYDQPIVTTLEPLTHFYPAEKYHQDFVARNPTHPYVRQWAVPKVKKVQEKFQDQVKVDQR
jgi:peptide-methionine (S)-S-oxide reductase